MLFKYLKKALCFVVAILLCSLAAFPASVGNAFVSAGWENQDIAQVYEMLQNKEKTFSKEDILLNMAVLYCDGDS